MLKGKNAIITGGVRGIGRGIAEEFCRQGANVMLCYRSNDAAAQEAVQALSAYGTTVLTYKGDAADFEQAGEAVKAAVEAFGQIDILVNNAGVTNDKLLMRMSSEDFVNVINTNLVGTFNFTRHVAAHMVRKKSGKIINMSSIVGVKGNPGQANYAASKAGVIGLTLSNAKELAKRNITVNAIAPGFIDTEMTSALTEEQREKSLEFIGLGRFGTTEDIANTAVFLASDKAAYITGQVICVDGGLVL